MISTLKFLAVGALGIAGFGAGHPVSVASHPSETSAALGCWYCTLNSQGTEHTTGSSGSGINAASLHDGMWQASSCSDHHVPCGEGSEAFRAKGGIERLIAIARRGDIVSLRAEIASAPAGVVAYAEREGRVDVLSCGGRVVAVIWMSSKQSTAD